MKKKSAIAGVLGFIALNVFISLIVGSIYGAYCGYTNQLNNINKNGYTVTLFAHILTTLTFIYMYRKKQENFFVRCNFKKIKKIQVLKIIALGIGLALVSCSIINLIQDKIPSYKQVEESIKYAYNSFITLSIITIFIPIFEEILFRVMIFKELKTYVNLGSSILIQSIIFSIYHGNLVQGIYVFFLGVTAAMVYEWTGSCISNMLLHITYNIFGVLVVPMLIYYTNKLILLYLIVGIIMFTLLFINILKKINLSKSNNKKISI